MNKRFSEGDLVVLTRNVQPPGRNHPMVEAGTVARVDGRTESGYDVHLRSGYHFQVLRLDVRAPGPEDRSKLVEFESVETGQYLPGPGERAIPWPNIIDDGDEIEHEYVDPVDIRIKIAQKAAELLRSPFRLPDATQIVILAAYLEKGAEASAEMINAVKRINLDEILEEEDENENPVTTAKSLPLPEPIYGNAGDFRAGDATDEFWIKSVQHAKETTDLVYFLREPGTESGPQVQTLLKSVPVIITHRIPEEKP
jgi:hypothetical protein